MSFDVEAYLREELGLEGDSLSNVLGVLKPHAAKLESSVARQSDYSRKMDDLRKAQTDLAAQNETLNKEMADWAELTAAEKSRAGDMRTQIEASQREAFELGQTVKRLAEAAGLDPATVMKREPVDPKKPVEVQAPYDDAALRNQVAGVTSFLMDLNSELPALQDEYFELTGKKFPTKEFVSGIKADIASQKKGVVIDPVQRFEALYDIPALRIARQEKNIEDRIKKGRDEERALVMTEQALPGGHSRPAQHSPVLMQRGTSKLQRPQPGDRTTNAVAALASGKYRKSA